jgi:hypothetical protein
MKLYTVGASSMTASYSAGRFIAESRDEAIAKARERYRGSSLGQQLNDVGAFRFYITDEQKVDG